jgi:hypothetical protein
MNFEKIALVRSAVMDGLNAWLDAELQRTYRLRDRRLLTSGEPIEWRVSSDPPSLYSLNQRIEISGMPIRGKVGERRGTRASTRQDPPNREAVCTANHESDGIGHLTPTLSLRLA